MIRRLLLLLLIILGTYAFRLNNESHSVSTNRFKVTYKTKEGRLDGKYSSWYLNGYKRSEGAFSSNYRTGTWRLWDSTGVLITERQYTDPFTFKRKTPPTPDDPTIKLFSQDTYSLKYDSLGAVKYFDLEERMVVFSVNLLRTISRKNNEKLFLNNSLLSTIKEGLRKDELTAFTDYDFKMPLSRKDIPTFEKADQFLVLEAWFFDIERLVSEYRIIGICPMIEDIQDKKPKEAYWIYYPQLRKILAGNAINKGKIKTYENLFFFRDFHGEIIQIMNKYDRESGSVKTRSPEVLEIELIEKEHDLWLSLMPD